jgi:hypothetical protein
MSDTPSRPPAPPDPGGPDRWSARPVVRISRRNMWIAGAAGVGLLLLGVLLVMATLPRFLTTGGGNAEDPGAAAAGSARRIQATLFYVSENGRELVSESRQVPYGATPPEQARLIVQAAVDAPSDGRRSAIPAGTTVRSVFLTGDGRAFVDLGGAIVSGHSGGTLNEALAVYAIVNAVTVNLPDIAAVQILIDGRQVDTLAGHLDLRHPLGKTLDWVGKGQ